MSFPPFDSAPHPCLLQCDAVGFPGPLFHGGFFYSGLEVRACKVICAQSYARSAHSFLKSDLTDKRRPWHCTCQISSSVPQS
jgi:hypothetical protein